MFLRFVVEVCGEDVGWELVKRRFARNENENEEC